MSFLSETTSVFINVIGMGFGLDVVLGRRLWILIGKSHNRQNNKMNSLAVGIIPCAMAIVELAYLEETPKFLLIHKNDRGKAMEAMEFYQGWIPKHL